MLVLIILIQLNLASYALGTNAWYSPEGEQTPNDVVHNVVWLNRSPQTLIFQTEISEWTLSVHQFGAPNSAQITCKICLCSIWSRSYVSLTTIQGKRLTDQPSAQISAPTSLFRGSSRCES